MPPTWATGKEATTSGILMDALPPDVVNITTTTSGQEVIITFREEIGPAPLLLRAAQAVGVDAGVFYQALFNVYVDSFEVVPSGASITSRQLSLSVQHPITDVQEVAVSYDNLFAKAAPGILLDQGGNPLASFEKRGGSQYIRQPRRRKERALPPWS